MFFTFEGIDGSGKSTQMILLRNYLRDKDKEVLSLREPGSTEFSEQIRGILLNSTFNISSVTELMLFEAARSDLVENVIKPAISEGKIVLCDRFYDSTIAYQGYGRMLPIDIIKSMNLLATGGLKPSKTFFLDIPIELSQKRIYYKKIDRLESAGNDFFLRVIEGFRKLAEQEPERIVIIDGDDSIENIFNKIVENLKSII